MSELRPSISYLADILAAMDKVEEFIHGFDEAQFQGDDKTIFALDFCKTGRGRGLPAVVG